MLAEARKYLMQEVESLRGIVAQMGNTASTPNTASTEVKAEVSQQRKSVMPPGSFLQGLEFSSDEDSEREEAKSQQNRSKIAANLQQHSIAIAPKSHQNRSNIASANRAYWTTIMLDFIGAS